MQVFAKGAIERRDRVRGLDADRTDDHLMFIKPHYLGRGDAYVYTYDNPFHACLYRIPSLEVRISVIYPITKLSNPTVIPTFAMSFCLMSPVE